MLALAGPGTWVFRSWSSTAALVMGRFQREEYEVNETRTRKHNAPVLRRFTGGGTVWQDPGVLNLTFVRDREEPFVSRLVHSECRHLVQVIRIALDPAEELFFQDERHAMFHGEKKIMGSAAGLIEKRFLFHASLLINADLIALTECILPEPDYPPEGAFVKSRRSPVTNIAGLGFSDRNMIISKIVDQFILQQSK